MSRVPFYSSNAAINPGYYSNSIGQAELAQERQIALEGGLRDARDAIATMPQYVQQGSTVFTAEQRRNRQEIADEAGMALDALAPLVATGVADADTIRQVLGKTMSNTLSDQRNRAAAERDLADIFRLHEQGGLTVKGTIDAVASAAKEHGTVVYSTKAFARYSGLEQKYQEQKAIAQQEFAKANGVPVKYTRWNEETGQPDYDTRALAMDSAMATLRDKQAKPIRERNELQLEAIKQRDMAGDREYEQTKEWYNNQIAIAEADENPAEAKRLREEFSQVIQRRRAGMQGLQQQAESIQRGPTITRTIQFATPQQLGITVGPPIKFDYKTRDEAVAAANAGLINAGDYANVNGSPYRLDANRVFQPVSR